MGEATEDDWKSDREHDWKSDREDGRRRRRSGSRRMKKNKKTKQGSGERRWKRDARSAVVPEEGGRVERREGAEDWEKEQTQERE